ncbi:MAG: hypothetical protein IT287_05285 [Bdellovibrionaceae bacterium]|nr:hypothetical protein [Pseudobdellovibrionaceae bacterium]
MAVTLHFLSILLICLSPLIASAALFTVDESEAAQAVGRQSVQNAMRAHRSHLQKTGVGLYYGIQSSYSPLKKLKKPSDKIWSDLERFSYIKTVLHKDFVQKLGSVNAVDTYAGSLVGLQEEEPRRGDLEMTSSLLWALKHVSSAYIAAGKKERAEQIVSRVKKNGNQPQTLLVELQKDGWHSIYWNPDVALPSENNSNKAALHLRSWQEAQKGSYLNENIKVDYHLINFRPTKGSKTKKDLSSLKKLKHIPFWVGIANYGRHTFVGYQNHISEAYNTELPTSQNLIMDSSFESWFGHYASEKLLSGIIMAPPGSL